ncbi:MAG: RHS repeat-associated core domain-containing protein, partial [Eubacterium sp.]|nr:RHS repeat-associated core domain-containing protein [Eubacterium sp.]
FVTCNSRGDVEALYSASGNLVAKYVYDSWGNTISVTDANGKAITSKSHIGNVNPIRYRGYYFDSETGFYYLQSRYYNPTIGRFLNADIYCDTGTGLLGTNMFAYCENNPINSLDSNGYMAAEAAGAVATGKIIVDVLLCLTGLMIVYFIVKAVCEALNGSVTIEIPSTAEIADENLRSEVQKGKNEGIYYWKAYRIGGFVVLGDTLTKNEALKRVSKGRDVFTTSGQSAYWLAKEASGGIIPVGPEFDDGKENVFGYYEHYHTIDRNGAHIFFI